MKKTQVFCDICGDEMFRLDYFDDWADEFVGLMREFVEISEDKRD